MRIWLIGADSAGTAALQQLQKNPDIQVIVSDAIERPKAVERRVIERVDYVESVTPLNINQLARRIRPDLILLDRSALQRAYGRLSEGFTFAESIQEEIAAASEWPCLVL
ncbi:MAG: hypothetical protein NZ553_20340 [Caldilinea sp.]|nr:hypothetical protein [Caldilinea sp.]MDW8442836.1 hypothetical protein [Caldilineaceae bacterium]